MMDYSCCFASIAVRDIFARSDQSFERSLVAVVVAVVVVVDVDDVVVATSIEGSGSNSATVAAVLHKKYQLEGLR